jgi:hypothetical protein
VTIRLDESIARRDQLRRPVQRLRRLVGDIDMMIAACEHAHLRRDHRVSDDLVARARSIWPEASAILAEMEDRDGQEVVDRVASASVLWVHDLMDSLWTVQDAIFDVLVPWRQRIRDEEEAAPWSDGVPA